MNKSISTATIKSILSALDQYGFCMVPSVISTVEAIRLRNLIYEFQEQETKPGDENLNHVRVLHLVVKNEVFLDLMCHPLALSVCDEFLGSDFLCSTWSSNTVLPNSDFTYWHVDHPYWTIQSPYPVNPPLTMHAIWCLDEFTPENGATKFIPGSHRRTHLPVHNKNYDEESIVIEAPMGSVIFAHGACWHSGGKNTTDSPRTGIFGRYARSYIIPQEEMKDQLSAIKDPTPVVERLLGGKQYIPQKGFPY